MAAPPPAYSTPHTGNPDRRPLPDGWITRYDDNYRAWYYVDTRAHPPRSSWEHPLGPPPATPAGNYAPPPHPPRAGGGYNPGGSTPGTFPPSQPNPSYPGGSYSGYQGNPQDQRSYQPSTYSNPQPYGGGNYANTGNPAWPQQGWQQQPPTQLGYQPQPASQAIQQPPRSGRSTGGIGLGSAAALGVGGLVAGGLLTEAFEHHEDRERDEAYDQGLDQGYVDGQDNAEFGGNW